MKNVSTSEFILKSATPFFQVVESPLSPLRPSSKGYLKQTLIGGVLGGFLLVVFFIGRKVCVETKDGGESLVLAFFTA